jgi:hypothetical protein
VEAISPSPSSSIKTHIFFLIYKRKFILMITLFENFANKIDIKDFIKKEGDKFMIPHLSFKGFGEWALKNPSYTQIKYNSLMRFYLYMKLLRYNGDSPIIKTYVEGLKRKDPKKLEIINKIPNNIHVLNMVNEIFKFDYPKYDYDNLTNLKKLIFANEEVLSDRNLTEYIDMVFEASEKASKSEKIVKGVINMLYSKYFEVTYAKLAEDLKGMDLWKINKSTGVRQSIQVKNITGGVRFRVSDDNIFINNTSLDLHDYKCWKDKLPYDYIVFYIERDAKICIIKSTAIFAIDIFDNNKKDIERQKAEKTKIRSDRTIKIKLKNWAMDPEFNKYVFKLIDVPKKFIGKDVSKIFYTPDIEQEIQTINPEVAPIEPEGKDDIKSKGIFI